ncbi:hypothetical protein [Chryseobacterium sp.]|uniref:hypothetical protein n=2 Tax=Chryseobacterium sp. TaxID=1871047 RepID=UPI002FCCA68B
MLKSKFKFRALLIPVLIIAITSISAYIITENWPIKIEGLRWIEIYMTVLFLFTWVWLVFGELRTKVIEVTIENNTIEKRNYLGLNQKYNFKDFDGFQTSILTSKGESFEYLYLVKDSRKIIKISEAYHKNYGELKNRIGAKSKELGEIKFSYIDELKDIFK